MEETDNKKSYKYNGYPLDYNRVINTMKANWQSYAQHMHWTSDQERLARTKLNDLLQAAENGMSSDYAGDLIGGTDAEGNVTEIQMSNPSWTDKKGKDVDADTKKGLSARKQSKLTPNFDPTAEAVRYWQTIVQFVADKTREEIKQKEADEKAEEERANTPVPFTMADNGFWPTFIDTVSPNGIADFDLDWWWGLDPYNKATGTRAVTGRTAELSNVLNDYIKKLESTNYDFSKEKVTKDEYLANLKKLQAALADNSLDFTDRGLLQRVGGTPADYKKLFMTDETWTETPSEEEEEENELDPEIVAALRQAKAAYVASKSGRNNGAAPAGQRVTIPNLAGDTAADKLNSWLTRLATDRVYKAPDNIYEIFNGGDFRDQEGGGLEKYMGQYLTLLENYGNEIGTPLVRKVSYGPYSGYKYIVDSLNRDDMTVLAYNPSTGHTTRIFYPELGSEELASALNVKVAIKDTAAMLEKIFGTSSSSETPKKQAGGTIDFDAARDAMEALTSSRAESLAKSQADPTQRRPWAAADITNNNEWSTADIARIGSIVADIAAIVSPESYTSLGFSLAGDIGNFIADRSEGYTMLQSLGHLGVGLAGSAASLIPIVGGALGKTGRVTKGLAKLAPKIAKWMSYVGAAGLLANSPEILKSLGKLTSNDPNEKMTMGDWRNILLGLEAILATKQGFKARKVANARLNQAKTGETMVKVKMVGKPEEKGLIGIGGDDAKRLMVASENNDIEGINRILKGYNNGKWELDTHLEVVKKPKEHFYEGIFTKRKTIDTPVMEPGSVYENLNPAQISTKDSKLPPYMRNNKIMPDNPTITAKKTPIKTPKAKPAAEAEAKPAKASITKQNELISKAKEAYGKLPEGMTAAKAKTLDVKDHPHSDAFKELAKTYDETSLIENGYWKRGGKISRARKVAKANSGESLSFSSGSLGSRTSENTGKGLGRKIVKAEGGTKLYGISDEDWNKYVSYGSEYAPDTVAASARMKTANNDLRKGTEIDNKYLKEHPVNYANLQESAQGVRGDYWSDSDANARRRADFINYAINWRKDNPEGTLKDLLAAYNNDIALMYDYRYGRQGDKDWYANTGASAFNQAHRKVYGGLNSKDWLGYNEDLQDWYGSTSSIRPIDITKEAVDLDLSDYEWGEGTEWLQEMLKDAGLTKAANGMYYQETPAAAPAADNNPGNTGNTGNPKEGDNIDFTDYFINPNTSSTGHDLVNKPYRGDFSMLGPDLLSLTRYLGSIPTNWQMYKNAKKMPITLYNPQEAHRWVYGDQNAIQQGYRAAGIANHMAANPLTSDGALQTAAQFSAFDQGQDYIRNGYTTNDNMVRKTMEANWTQDRTNQQSRYDVHNKNLDNLALHRTSVLTADATRRNTNYNSWSNFLSGLEQNWRGTAEKRQQQASAYAKLSKQNELLKMHIDSLKDDKDRQAINEVVMGMAEYSDLSDTQKKLYLEIMHRVQEGLTKWEAGNIGVGYQPYLPGPYAGTSGTTPTSGYQISDSGIPYGRRYKRGGVVGGDTEKVAIQKLRTRVQKMQIFQKHLDSRMTACEKALDRAQRSASQYWRGMTKGK